jgi:cytochrome c biogenesis protein CcdA
MKRLAHGIGTALPVLLFALLIALGAKSISAVFSKVTEFEIWGRRITGWVFILVGIYFCLVYVFGVQL